VALWSAIDSDAKTLSNVLQLGLFMGKVVQARDQKFQATFFDNIAKLVL
jgi:hypothetical protein